MSVIKIVFTIAACFIMFDHVQSGVPQISADQFHGVWFTIRVMAPIFSCQSVIECEWLNVRQSELIKRKFRIFGGNSVNDVNDVWTASGFIDESGMHFVFPPNKTLAHIEVTQFNNGDELILFSRDDKSLSKLLSRTRTASAEVRFAFKKRAIRENMHVLGVNHDNCA